jgi:hypothetical protein
LINAISRIVHVEVTTLKVRLADTILLIFPGVLLILAPLTVITFSSFGCIDLKVPSKFEHVVDVRVRFVDDTGDSGQGKRVLLKDKPSSEI